MPVIYFVRIITVGRRQLFLVYFKFSIVVVARCTRLSECGSYFLEFLSSDRTLRASPKAMCWFYVTKGIQLRVNLLPQRKADLWQAMHDMRMVADTPPKYHDRAWEATCAEWHH
jgi:hypothetical protein